MRQPASRASRTRKCLSWAAAVALPLTAVVAIATAEEPATAAELSGDRFELPFADVATPEVVATTSPSEILDTSEMGAIEAPSAETAEAKALGSGNASYYGADFAGRRTASGERFDPGKLTAAHRSLPFGSRVKVTNQRNGKSVVVRINDRGPFHGNRVIDLSRGAAERIGIVRQGKGRVELALLSN